jgi:hypothetical protein
LKHARRISTLSHPIKSFKVRPKVSSDPGEANDGKTFLSSKSDLGKIPSERAVFKIISADGFCFYLPSALLMFYVSENFISLGFALCPFSPSIGAQSAFTDKKS